jgi:hypothetical protein
MGPVSPSDPSNIMDLAKIKSYQRTIASVDLPLRHFIETGFWNPRVVEGWNESDIGDSLVRSACRKVAKELKRPFIQCYSSFVSYESYDTGETSQNGYAVYNRRPLPEPRFEAGYVEMPKRKHLAPLVAPLLLAAGGKVTLRDAVWDRTSATLWAFLIRDREFWDSYYDFVLNDPECRRARRLTS